MNKKGDIPTIILFFVALVMSGIALFAFASYGKELGSVSQSMNNLLEKTNSYEKFSFDESAIIVQRALNCEDCVETDIKGKIREFFVKEEKSNADFRGNLFGKIRNNEFEFYSNGENYVLNINDLFIEAREGDSKIRRNFNISIEFDKTGNAIRFINK